MSSLKYYFLGTASWFFAYGIQSVTFAWLVTMVLNESPPMVGIAQMALLLPATLLMLVGGSLADHYGGRRLVIVGHLLAACAPLILILLLVVGRLSYAGIIVFAVVMGTAQAVVTPARDGLLALVAEGRIQKRVMQASMIQFSIQMMGFVVASFADRTGAILILCVQTASLVLGTLAYAKLELGHPHQAQARLPSVRQLMMSIYEGYLTVRESPPMRMVVVQNVAMGMFFMGSYIVTIPLIVRESYLGSAGELSLLNVANSLGLVITIMLLLKQGDIKRQGRALLLAQGIGSFFLAGGGLGLGFSYLVVFIFAWGVCGGVAMTMSRTIMQEQAPVDQRARMMGFFAFSFMGSGPIGALFCGFLAEALGPDRALVVSAGLMFVVVAIVSSKSGLWRLHAD